MPTAKDVAERLATTFNPHEISTVERAVEIVLLELGFNQYDAPVEAERLAPVVLRMLRSMLPTKLPFDLSESEPFRLIGKARPRPQDSSRTGDLRSRLVLVDATREALLECASTTFEKVCARLMDAQGATETVAIAAGDEGGIDLYGRLPLRLHDPDIPQGLVRSSFLRADLLFFGQCKRLARLTPVGRPEIQQFASQVDDCLEKYEHFSGRIPSRHVPFEYYRRNELALLTFFTTSHFTDSAVSAASGHDMILVDGRQIAELMILHGIGLVGAPENLAVSPEAIEAWAGVR